jgi:hemoglobin-like flavoprotein
MEITSKDKWNTRSVIDAVVPLISQEGFLKTHNVQTGPRISEIFYATLFQEHEDMRTLFSRFNLLQTIKAIGRLVDERDLSVKSNSTVSLGKRHYHYGVREEHFEIIGNALETAFVQTLEPWLDTEKLTSWRKCYKWLSKEMTLGNV